MGDRQIKPLNTKFGELMRTISQLLQEKELMRDEISEQIQRYFNMCKQNGFSISGISGIDYTKDKVLGSSYKMEFCDIISKIDALQSNLNKVLTEIEELKEKRKRILILYKNDESLEAKVFYYREIMRYSQERTAAKIEYSVRQVQRIEKKIREQTESQNLTRKK